MDAVQTRTYFHKKRQVSLSICSHRFLENINNGLLSMAVNSLLSFSVIQRQLQLPRGGTLFVLSQIGSNFFQSLLV
jgi:hypothetical protein